MILKQERNYPKWGTLLWSFSIGLTVDILSNTPGMAAASLTLIGAIQPYFMELFVQRDAADNLTPSLKTLGYGKFTFFASMLTLFYCLVFFTLETFSFFNFSQWIAQILGSALISLVIILTIESVRKQ